MLKISSMSFRLIIDSRVVITLLFNSSCSVFFVLIFSKLPGAASTVEQDAQLEEKHGVPVEREALSKGEVSHCENEASQGSSLSLAGVDIGDLKRECATQIS